MIFRIHNEGWVFFISSLIFSIIIFFFLPILGLIFLTVSFYVYYFFRDPIRSIPKEDVIVSPADGIVTYIGDSEPPISLNEKNNFLKISIFLNIFNVHVNRMPTSGTIKNINYVHGKFINATLNKSSEDNEKNIITLQKENKDIIIITQIAGLIARRIVCDVKEKQQVYKGHRFGIIKFGSRVDLYIPSNYKPLISLGQVVVGGETIMSNPNNIKKISNSIKN
jgi:phosphatidylserine decarboxylase